MNQSSTFSSKRRAALALGTAAVVGGPASVVASQAAEPPMQSKDMTDNVVLIVRFVPKPGKYSEFREHLFVLIDKMSAEPEFVQAIVHDDLDTRGQLVIHETWKGTRERFIAEQRPKAYRQSYEARLTELLERRDRTWLTPLRAWGMGLSKR